MTTTTTPETLPVLTALLGDLLTLLGGTDGPITPTTTKPARATRTRKATTTKATTKAQPKRAKAPSRKPVYEEIRRLTAAGQHDDAVALAQEHGWSHVVDSVNAHRAKHAESATASGQVTRKATRTRKAASTATAKRATKAGTKAPAKAATKPVKPTTKAASKATKAASKAGAKEAPAMPAPVAPTGKALTEADLVDYWAECIVAKHADIARAALLASRIALGEAVKQGDAGAIQVQATRVRTLQHLLSEAGEKLA